MRKGRGITFSLFLTRYALCQSMLMHVFSFAKAYTADSFILTGTGFMPENAVFPWFWKAAE